MQITQTDGSRARCAARGVEREVSLTLLQDDLPREGDFVLIHVGYAIQKLTEEEAMSSWELLDQMADEEIASA